MIALRGLRRALRGWAGAPRALRAGFGLGLGSIVFVFTPAAVAAQETSLWLDASASHARPPANVLAEPTSYGLLGARLRSAGSTGGVFELGAHGGLDATAGTGRWGNLSAVGELARNAGILSYGARAEAFALRYASSSPGPEAAGVRQTFAAATLRPTVGVSMGRVLLRVEPVLTRGTWRFSTPRLLLGGGGPPLLGGGSSSLPDSTASGTIAITGVGASLVTLLGGTATLQFSAERLAAENQIVDGTYEGLGATLGWGSGALDFSVGGKLWRSPGANGATREEVGVHGGIGAAIGESLYAQFSLARSVADPMYGTAGSVAASLGMSVRLGGSPAPAPAVQVGAPANGGRRVVFRFERDDAQRVAVAGDFSGWEQREMQRAGDAWRLEVVLPPGVHHYAFVVNGEEWTVPDDASGVVDDGFGRRNATVVVPG